MTPTLIHPSPSRFRDRLAEQSGTLARLERGLSQQSLIGGVSWGQEGDLMGTGPQNSTPAALAASLRVGTSSGDHVGRAVPFDMPELMTPESEAGAGMTVGSAPRVDELEDMLKEI